MYRLQHEESNNYQTNNSRKGGFYYGLCWKDIAVSEDWEALVEYALKIKAKTAALQIVDSSLNVVWRVA